MAIDPSLVEIIIGSVAALGVGAGGLYGGMRWQKNGKSEPTPNGVDVHSLFQRSVAAQEQTSQYIGESLEVQRGIRGDISHQEKKLDILIADMQLHNQAELIEREAERRAKEIMHDMSAA